MTTARFFLPGVCPLIRMLELTNCAHAPRVRAHGGGGSRKNARGTRRARFTVPGCEWRRVGRRGGGGGRACTPRTRGNKGAKARGQRASRAEGKERARGREPLFVTVSGLSRSIISRKVLLTALIFRLFLPLPCCSFFPFVLSLAPFFLFLIVNSARSFRRLSARRHA